MPVHPPVTVCQRPGAPVLSSP
ncbi:rCG43030 [Rattus norvegicus]|uniref:RCG43030 n=1 Tax=Rattus norvegicus TaxID=10116 RepID=A6IWK9_RAT|nr:rCG43030 [Rattus norvegicus]